LKVFKLNVGDLIAQLVPDNDQRKATDALALLPSRHTWYANIGHQSVSRTWFYKMRHLCTVQQSLTKNAFRSLVQALKHCRVDYCNAVPDGTADIKINGCNHYRIPRLV